MSNGHSKPPVDDDRSPLRLPPRHSPRCRPARPTAATCLRLTPQLRDITVVQGVGSYSPLGARQRGTGSGVSQSAVVCGQGLVDRGHGCDAQRDHTRWHHHASTRTTS